MQFFVKKEEEEIFHKNEFSNFFLHINKKTKKFSLILGAYNLYFVYCFREKVYVFNP